MTDAPLSASPRLGRELVRSGRLTSGRVVLPDPVLLDLPERAVQFGTGAFIRGFIDYFLDEANRRGNFGGRVVAIASTPSHRDALLNEQQGLYTLVVEGPGTDGPHEERRVVASVSRALAAQSSWEEVLSLARDPELRIVFSNTTEVGIAIVDTDRFEDAPPASFPAKLARFLVERGRALAYARDAGVVVLPCELIEQNGDRLRDLVLTLASRWQIEPAFATWIAEAVPFCNTLVDRIVPGKPNDDKRHELETTLGFHDELMITAEPYRLFAIEADPSIRERLSFAKADDGIILTDDVTPFRERKVRILNGSHTLLAPMALAVGCRTVLDAVRHDPLARYLRRVLDEEIVPSLTAANGEAFALDVLTRFANPYLRHALTDITLQQTAKIRVRVIPSIIRYAERTGAAPTSLAFGFAAYLCAIRTSVAADAAARLPLAPDNEGERVREVWRTVSDQGEKSLRDCVQRICSDAALWQTDLTQVAGFADRVTADLSRMTRGGVSAALAAHLDAHQSGPKSVTASFPMPGVS